MSEETLTKEAKRALFEKYDVANAELVEHEQHVDAAKQARSEAVKEIYEKVGKGPFNWNGQTLTIAQRGDSYFFRGPKPKEAQEI